MALAHDAGVIFFVCVCVLEYLVISCGIDAVGMVSGEPAVGVGMV
jgi:hypothetical protein